MYWKEKDSAGIVEQSIHGGDGVIRRRGFFDGVSHLPIKFQVWELDPGVSEGSHSHEGDTSLEEIYYFLEGSGTMWISKAVEQCGSMARMSPSLPATPCWCPLILTMALETWGTYR